MNITVSIGVSSCPENSTDVDGLIRAADDALYGIKRAAKNSIAVSAILPSPVPVAGQG
jgi:diguanylate cyclase (GGDEF)-like protein